MPKVTLPRAAAPADMPGEIPEFSEALLEGKALADADVAASLYNRARGMRLPAFKLFKASGEDPQVVEYEDYLPM
jgi:hypothetical protein